MSTNAPRLAPEDNLPPVKKFPPMPPVKKGEKFYKISAEDVKWIENCFGYHYKEQFENNFTEAGKSYGSGVIFMCKKLIRMIDKP